MKHTKNYVLIFECDVATRVQLVYKRSVPAVNISIAVWQIITYLLKVCTAVQNS
jgi:hypothetical protein